MTFRYCRCFAVLNMTVWHCSRNKWVVHGTPCFVYYLPSKPFKMSHFHVLPMLEAPYLKSNRRGHLSKPKESFLRLLLPMASRYAHLAQSRPAYSPAVLPCLLVTFYPQSPQHDNQGAQNLIEDCHVALLLAMTYGGIVT